MVDDEEDILDSLKALLESSVTGLKCKTAGSAADALKMLDQGGVDLILCDYRMPGMDGLKFLELARQKAPNVPRILMTAFPHLELAIEAINEARVEIFLTKPMDPDKLIGVVQDTLRSRKATRTV
ncbi:MAG: response regulator [bacterium]